MTALTEPDIDPVLEAATAALREAEQAHLEAHNAWVDSLPVLPASDYHENMYLVDPMHDAWKYASSCILSQTDEGEMCWIVGAHSRGWDEFGDMDTPYNYYVYNDSAEGSRYYRLPENCDIAWD